ncbi:unknown protein [Microcystis aeruginosa NIES-843]|uniref:Uncharacterized protein n=1 Tax=Microcystis aeruginosa (strain NIES-843 / IAM M-2473) TaxID=449447 RepID=B0JL35_MICAN|nr:unknown protein [Microcystis aeruginosa NIES-843]
MRVKSDFLDEAENTSAFFVDDSSGIYRLERAQFPRDQPHSSTPTEICEPGRTSPFDKSIRVTLTAANKLPR